MSPTMYSGIIAEEEQGQNKHQDGTDHPVLHEGKTQYFPVAKYPPELFIPDLGKGWVHHQNEAERDRDVGRPDLKALDKRLDPGTT